MFVDRVRNQLHVVLAMSPVGDAFRNRLRQFPSLVNCCTIDWFQVSIDRGERVMELRGDNIEFHCDVLLHVFT